MEDNFEDVYIPTFLYISVSDPPRTSDVFALLYKTVPERESKTTGLD